MPEHIDSQESISKMSTSQFSSVEDLNATQEKSNSSPLQRLKKQWKEIKREWGPLMAAKEDLYDEYTFPPGRLSVFVKTAKKWWTFSSIQGAPFLIFDDRGHAAIFLQST
ncbi:hypothetical protein N7516_004376 [Penicillium verrucosum]|uniref:uncharacterized protein n=1 Tax=Penicillium verrucosum TaxID=60171 RepID=UPI0025455C9B|nr:uncharacterized protein N7516_004376 [Penicillium verrucosum]KAJ5944208.1 hypothetical protein N7516_004376 [Penicillium verrucosum]